MKNGTMILQMVFLVALQVVAWHPLHSAPDEKRFDNGPYLVGAGGSQEDPPLIGVKTTGTGFGPLGDGFPMPKMPNSTSFRGPTAPPLTGATPLDHTTKTKMKRFSWEKETTSNSSAIDAAAQAVHILDSTGLGGGLAPMEGAQALGGPLNTSIKGRAIDLANTTAAVQNLTDAAMESAPVEPAPVHGIPWDGPWDPISRSGLIPQVTPSPGVQEAVNDFNKSGAPSGVLVAGRRHRHHYHFGAKHAHKRDRHRARENTRPNVHHKRGKTKGTRQKHNHDDVEDTLIRRAKGHLQHRPRQ